MIIKLLLAFLAGIISSVFILIILPLILAGKEEMEEVD